MIILGIESTCDETAASLVEDGRHLLSNVISTSVKEQALYGGVVPEIASRRHCEFISATVKKALLDAGKTIDDVDAVAVTFGLINLYTTIGYPCFKVSAKTGEGIEQIQEELKGRVTLFSGHSGVGKSTLINAILPDQEVKTGEISIYHNKGMHTTTFSEMFPVPGDGYIIDTPGIKGFGTFDILRLHIALADMHAVCVHLAGDLDVVIHKERHTALAAERLQLLRFLEELPLLQRLFGGNHAS